MQATNHASEIHQPEGPLALRAAIVDDRNWFNQHPKEIVRFRPAKTQEFEQFERLAELPPTFIPSGYSETAPRDWVAVVEMMRMTGAGHGPLERSLRLRVCTVALRSKINQAKAAAELIERISHELLELADQESNDLQMPDEAA